MISYFKHQALWPILIFLLPAITLAQSTGVNGSGTGANGGSIATANPTAQVGPTVVNGSAATAMRSDAAPPINLTANYTWTGTHAFTSTATTVFTGAVQTLNANGSVSIQSTTSPVFGGLINFNNPQAATDAKNYRFIQSNTDLLGQTVNDAGSAAANWLDVSRTGFAITNMALGNATNNPTYQFLGTGTTTFSGNISAPNLPLSGTTASLGGSSVAAGACILGTATVANSTNAMAVATSPAADPGAGFIWEAFVSASGTVTVKLCNASGTSATPTATTYNVRVIQ